MHSGKKSNAQWRKTKKKRSSYSQNWIRSKDNLFTAVVLLILWEGTILQLWMCSIVLINLSAMINLAEKKTNQAWWPKSLKILNYSEKDLLIIDKTTGHPIFPSRLSLPNNGYDVNCFVLLLFLKKASVKKRKMVPLDDLLNFLTFLLWVFGSKFSSIICHLLFLLLPHSHPCLHSDIRYNMMHFLPRNPKKITEK